MTLPLGDFLRLGVALLVGFLIGLDRERAEARKHVDLFAGVRTFPLIALAGALPSLAVEAWGIAPLIAALAAFAALLGVAYYRSTAAGNVGATTEVAALVTFLLGALAGRGELVLAAGVGIAVALLLNAKPRLERFSQTLAQQDIDSALELGVISCIVLPLLPNEPMGPWGAWNPFEIWLVVVAVSALSFAGFIAVRWLGAERGLLLSGALGALVSSTAVTVAMASRSREDARAQRTAAAAVLLASTIMGWRVLLLVAAASGVLVLRVLPQIAAMSAVGALAAWRLVARETAVAAPAGEAPGNPFRLRQALAFALFYALVLFAMPAAREFTGAAGVYAATVLSSLVDVDAVTIAFARRARLGVESPSEATLAISLALFVNTLFKLGSALALGAGEFRKWTALGLGAMALVGALAVVGMYALAA
jgi:uncharacterized membrane protein (DUF4010 family)